MFLAFSIVVVLSIIILKADGSLGSGTGVNRGREGESAIKPNMRDLRMKQSKEGIARSFFHVESIMQAIKENKMETQVLESKSFEDLDKEEEISTNKEKSTKNNKKTTRGDEVNDMPSPYSTSFTYHFMEGLKIRSLDGSDASRQVTSMVDDHFTHCTSNEQATDTANIGDVFIASEYHKHTDQSPIGAYLSLPRQKRNDGFLLIRKVVATARMARSSKDLSSRTCVHIKTEDIHPLELFSSFQILSNVSNPYQATTYSTQEDEKVKEKEHKSKLSTSKSLEDFREPDPRMYSCSDSFFNPNDWFSVKPSTGGGSDWRYAIGLTYGCFEMYRELPGSFNFNYDWQAQT